LSGAAITDWAKDRARAASSGTVRRVVWVNIGNLLAL
jgi:hypothetical protein